MYLPTLQACPRQHTTAIPDHMSGPLFKVLGLPAAISREDFGVRQPTSRLSRTADGVLLGTILRKYARKGQR